MTTSPKPRARKAGARAGSAVLDVRALNRALLARQMLLERAAVTPLQAIERLVGLQAQAARPPFVGLWTRLASFARDDLAALVADGRVVKAMAMRCTLHLLSAADSRALWPALAPMLRKAVQGLGARAAGVDVDDIAALTRAVLARGPASFDDIRAHLKAKRPKLDERAMGYAARTALPLRFLPARAGDEDGAGGARWCFAPDAQVALAEETPGAWAGDAEEALRALVRRYLAAFGPATVADAQAWCGIKGLAAVFEGLGDALEVFTDDAGRALYDVRGAPRPDPGVDAPVRFVADFDNLVLAHADRRRIVADEHKKLLVTKNLLVRATLLVDGFVAGTWRTERKARSATLVVEPFAARLVPKRARAALEEEGERLLTFVEPDATARAVHIAT